MIDTPIVKSMKVVTGKSDLQDAHMTAEDCATDIIKGVEKDRVQAFLWLSLAAQHGIGSALNALDGIVKHMSSEEKSEALNLFDLWRGKTAGSVGPSRIEPLPG